MPTDRRMNGAAGQWRPDGRHGTRRLFSSRLLFFRDGSALGDRRQHRRRGLWCYRNTRALRRGFVAFIAMCFLVRLTRGIVRVGVMHVVRNVLSVVLTQLNGYVFID
jgi:hypothetical protein